METEQFDLFDYMYSENWEKERESVEKNLMSLYEQRRYNRRKALKQFKSFTKKVAKQVSKDLNIEINEEEVDRIAEKATKNFESKAQCSVD